MNNISNVSFSAKFPAGAKIKVKTRYDDICEEIIREKALQHERKLNKLTEQYFEQNSSAAAGEKETFKISDICPGLAEKLQISA